MKNRTINGVSKHIDTTSFLNELPFSLSSVCVLVLLTVNIRSFHNVY
jgi:hypothetical protein